MKASKYPPNIKEYSYEKIKVIGHVEMKISTEVSQMGHWESKQKVDFEHSLDMWCNVIIVECLNNLLEEFSFARLEGSVFDRKN